MCRGQFLAACIGLFLSWHYHGLSVATEPGFLDFDNLPETNFSCEGKVIGGYYADTETGCQMFHVCTIGQKGEITDIKFLCLNGTVFDQETRVCERLDEVDCSKSESFYDLNLELYGNNGAGYGIQPENEETPQNDQLCEEEDGEGCETEKPSIKTNPTEQVQASSEESEDEETTTQPFSSTTTSRRPVVTSTSYPSTTPGPQILQFPSTSPETIAALLALHKAFTQSLQQHSGNKDGKESPQLTGFVESLNPAKSTQQAETFEIRNNPPSPRPPTPFPPKPQTQFSVPQSPPKLQFPNHPKPLYQSPLKPQFQSAPKPQYQNQPKTQFQNQQKPQFQAPPKPPPTLPIPPAPQNQYRPVQTTSERYGNTAFHHSFHINSQVGHYAEPNYQDHYSDHDHDHDISQSSQLQTEGPKQYDFNDYEDDYYDEKPHSSTITPYLLHQLKVNQVKSANQAKIASASSSSSGHGSFVREVSSTTPTKPFNIPSFRSVTPGIAIITATSTTSSSSVKTSKPNNSAILSQKGAPSAAGFLDSLLNPSNSSLQELPDPPQSYDDYKEGDVRSDPFYKDVPKISRNKRSIDHSSVNSVTFVDNVNLLKLKDKLVNSVFRNNSETILRVILNQYCSDKINSSDSLDSYCSSVQDTKLSNTEFGDKWKIVIPKGDDNYLYLVKTISSSNEDRNITSKILLLINFPDEFKLTRDSIFRDLESKQRSSDLIIDSNSVDSSIHHRFKRVKRNNHHPSLKRKTKKHVELKKSKLITLRKKRQTYSTEFDENLKQQPETLRVRTNTRPRPSPVVVRRRPVQVTDSVANVDEPKTRQVTRQQRPTRRRQPQPVKEVQHLPVQQETEEQVRDLHQSHVTENYPNPIQKTRDSIRTGEKTENYPQPDVNTRVSLRDEGKKLGRPTSRRRGEGVRYSFSERPYSNVQSPSSEDVSSGNETETSTTYPFNLKPSTKFSCDDKIKGGYYADVDAECYGYFICSQGEINGPLLKSHFWCGPTTKFNQRSRTCQMEALVACGVSERYFHLNKDILSLPDPDDEIKDSFEPSKVQS